MRSHAAQYARAIAPYGLRLTELWLSTEPHQPLPQTAPPARWAFYAIAKLGGFTDTQLRGV